MIKDNFKVDFQSPVSKNSFSLGMFYYKPFNKGDQPEMQFDLIQFVPNKDSKLVCSNIDKDTAIQIRDRLNEFIEECEK